MTVPSFLVVGGMKCGTTTLYEDLRARPDITLLEKEASTLLREQSVAAAEAVPLPRQFPSHNAPSSALLGEVSTTYSMLPHKPNAAEIARRRLPHSTKVVYILREPLARIISHHYHDFSVGRVTGSIDDVIREDERFLNYSRYAMQAQPWIDVFGRPNVLLMRFEDYVLNRQRELCKVLHFLGRSTDSPSPDERAHNRSEGKHVAAGGWGIVINSTVYRNLVRDRIPIGVRNRLRDGLLPEAPGRPEPPRPDTVRYIRDALRDDQARLAEIVGEEWWPI